MGAGDWLKDSVSPREPVKAAPSAKDAPAASNSTIPEHSAAQQRFGYVPSNGAASPAPKQPASRAAPPKAAPPQSPPIAAKATAKSAEPPALHSSALAASAKSSSAPKLLAACACLLVLISGACLAYVRFSPASTFATTVQSGIQTCASSLPDAKKLMSEIPAMPAMPKMPKVSSANFLSKSPHPKAADEKKELSASSQSMVETIAIGAGAAVTSTIGYGIYWLMTQG
jgi:hypothetical protein